MGSALTDTSKVETVKYAGSTPANSTGIINGISTVPLSSAR